MRDDCRPTKESSGCSLEEHDRPLSPPGAEIMAQAYESFESWRREHDPEGEGDFDFLVRDYTIHCLRQQVTDAEIALRVWDRGGDSEYWLRYHKYDRA